MKITITNNPPEISVKSLPPMRAFIDADATYEIVFFKINDDMILRFYDKDTSMRIWRSADFAAQRRYIPVVIDEIKVSRV